MTVFSPSSILLQAPTPQRENKMQCRATLELIFGSGLVVVPISDIVSVHPSIRSTTLLPMHPMHSRRPFIELPPTSQPRPTNHPSNHPYLTHHPLERKEKETLTSASPHKSTSAAPAGSPPSPPRALLCEKPIPRPRSANQTPQSTSDSC